MLALAFCLGSISCSVMGFVSRLVSFFWKWLAFLASTLM